MFRSIHVSRPFYPWLLYLSEVGDGHNTFCFGQIAGFMDRGSLILHPKFSPWSLKGELAGGQFFEALTNNAWVFDIQGAITVGVIYEFLLPFGIYPMKYAYSMELRILIFGAPRNGIYSAQSAYSGLLQGTIIFWPWQRIWKSWAPSKCKFFM